MDILTIFDTIGFSGNFGGSLPGATLIAVLAMTVIVFNAITQKCYLNSHSFCRILEKWNELLYNVALGDNDMHGVSIWYH